MFYRRLKEELFTAVDLTSAYLNSPIFIVAGNPVINSLPLGDLEASRLPTLALNNALYTYPNPAMWLTADAPSCYGGHFFARADIIKFACIDYKGDVVEATGLPLMEHPMQLFYMAAPLFRPEDFFQEAPVFAWWRSVFPLSLQLAWRLGFRRIYLVGCSFTMGEQQSYAWDTKLTDFETRWSQGTYDADIRRLRLQQPLFKENGFHIFSCTPESRANDILPYLPLDEAITRELQLIPTPTPTSELKHSSEFRRRGG